MKGASGFWSTAGESKSAKDAASMSKAGRAGAKKGWAQDTPRPDSSCRAKIRSYSESIYFAWVK